MNKTFRPRFAIGEKIFFVDWRRLVGGFQQGAVRETIVTGYDVVPDVRTRYPNGTRVRFDKDGNPLPNPVEVYVDSCTFRYQIPFSPQPVLLEEQAFPTREAAEESIRNR